MKIRQGFVSNSSSSSYIVSIDISPKKFYNLLYDEYNGWCIDKLTEKIAKHIAMNKNNIIRLKRQDKEYAVLNDKWRLDNISYTETKLIKLEEIYNIIIDDVNAESVISAILAYANITVNLEDKIILTGQTSMHNDFQDMPKMLNEIMSFFLFDTIYAVTCYREGQYGEIIKDEVGD